MISQPSVQELFVSDGVESGDDDVRGCNLVGLNLHGRHLERPRNPFATDGNLDNRKPSNLYYDLDDYKLINE